MKEDGTAFPGAGRFWAKGENRCDARARDLKSLPPIFVLFLKEILAKMTRTT
jgi:hypothetical protein